MKENKSISLGLVIKKLIWIKNNLALKFSWSESVKFLNTVVTDIDHMNRFWKEGNIEPLDIVVDEADVFKADKNHKDSINILEEVLVQY